MSDGLTRLRMGLQRSVMMTLEEEFRSRVSAFLERTGLGRTTIYRWRVEGRFPRAIPLGTRNVGWIESELEGWMRERMADRRGVAVGAAH